MLIDKKTFSYGCELEWGDVPKYLEIPENLGRWEYSETDIVNLKEPCRFIAVDPLGKNPKFGGEINVKPTIGWKGQINKIIKIKRFFAENGFIPTKNCISNFHIHVHIPGLINNIVLLKKLIRYIGENQEVFVNRCSGYKDEKEIKELKIKSYLKYDSYRKMPDYIMNNILEKATDFNSFIKLHCAGKDGVSMGRPFRYAINTYSLKHIKTIEFRCFRNTISIYEMACCFKLVEEFMIAALETNKKIEEIFNLFLFALPEFYFDYEEASGWLKTKYPKERGKKVRIYEKI